MNGLVIRLILRRIKANVGSSGKSSYNDKEDDDQHDDANRVVIKGKIFHAHKLVDDDPSIKSSLKT